jgi:hypothetical protein
MKQLTLTAALLAAPLAAVAGGHATTEAGLDGDWQSLSCEVRPQVGQDGAITKWWLTRAISMTPGRIEARFTTYGDAGCTFALNELHFAGRVDVVGPSDVAEGAVAANLTIDEFVKITPLAQPFADFLNSIPAGSCGAEAWKVGTAQAIDETGCVLLGVEPNTPTVEYEVLANLDGLLYFGARPVDGTFITDESKRPHALLVPLKPAE